MKCGPERSHCLISILQKKREVAQFSFFFSLRFCYSNDTPSDVSAIHVSAQTYPTSMGSLLLVGGWGITMVSEIDTMPNVTWVSESE